MPYLNINLRIVITQYNCFANFTHFKKYFVVKVLAIFENNIHKDVVKFEKNLIHQLC